MNKRTCTVDGCDRAHRARGLCGNHYNAKYRKPQVRTVQCAVCGEPVVKNGPGVKRRPTCGQRCRYFITFGRFPEDGKSLVGPVVRRPRPRPKAQDVVPSTQARFACGPCAWCGEIFTFDLRVGGVPAVTCSERCKSSRSSQRYRASRGRFAITKRRRVAIYERDGWTCQLCEKPVDPTLPPSHRWSATLDHIECQSWALIPDHSDANLRLAHLMCNSIRGDRAA